MYGAEIIKFNIHFSVCIRSVLSVLGLLLQSSLTSMTWRLIQSFSASVSIIVLFFASVYYFSPFLFPLTSGRQRTQRWQCRKTLLHERQSEEYSGKIIKFLGISQVLGNVEILVFFFENTDCDIH